MHLLWPLGWHWWCPEDVEIKANLIKVLPKKATALTASCFCQQKASNPNPTLASSVRLDGNQAFSQSQLVHVMICLGNNFVKGKDYKLMMWRNESSCCNWWIIIDFTIINTDRRIRDCKQAQMLLIMCSLDNFKIKYIFNTCLNTKDRKCPPEENFLNIVCSITLLHNGDKVNCPWWWINAILVIGPYS